MHSNTIRHCRFCACNKSELLDKSVSGDTTYSPPLGEVLSIQVSGDEASLGSGHVAALVRSRWIG